MGYIPISDIMHRNPLKLIYFVFRLKLATWKHVMHHVCRIASIIVLIVSFCLRVFGSYSIDERAEGYQQEFYFPYLEESACTTSLVPTGEHLPLLPIFYAFCLYLNC